MELLEPAPEHLERWFKGYYVHELQPWGYKWKDILKSDPCPYCGLPSSVSQMTVDHIEPRPAYRGPENQTGACNGCNHAKGSKSLLEYLLKKQRKRRHVRNRFGL